MKTHQWMFGLVAVGCSLGMALPPRVAAEVSDTDFNALKETVQKLGEQVQGLEQSNQVQQEIHQQDVQQIQQLQQEADRDATSGHEHGIEEHRSGGDTTAPPATLGRGHGQP
jgi:hypothetical protein